MDLNESQLTTALQEAFTCYLRFLSHTQRLRESKLPRQGKGVETKADVSTQQYYQSRVVATETCLQYTGKIAQRVLRWSNDPSDPIKYETLHIEPEVEQFGHFLDDEEPFLDIFTGTWIYPTTPFSAGPSGSQDEAASEKVEAPKNVQTECFPKTAHLAEKEAKVPEVKQIRPIFRSLTRPSLGIHPNAPISHSSSSIDRDSLQTTKSSTTRSDTPLTPNSSSTSEGESEEDGSHVKRKTNRRQIVKEEGIDSESTETSDDSEESEDDRTSVTSEMASVFYLQKNSRDIIHARKLYAEEKRRKEELYASRLQAQRMQDEWAREEKLRLRTQEALAKKFERQERERAEQIRKDREAAQRAQERWEAAAIARETEAMRAEERKRRESAEKERLADEQRKLKTQREGESRSAERLRDRNRISREEERRREEKLHSDARRRHREHERRNSPVRRPSPPRKADPPKKARFSNKTQSRRRFSPPGPRKSDPSKPADTTRKAESPRGADVPGRVEPSKQVDCVSCMEPGAKKDMAILPCKHAYCGDCIKEAFNSAYKSHTLFKCCGTIISTKSISQLPLSFTQRYDLLVLELSTKTPKYCSSTTCSKFLPPSSIHGPLGICPACRTRTCIPCGNGEHSGVCKEDKEGKKLEDLAKKRGWKQCPNCSQILERTYGCLHMTCRCGSEWCYSCLRDWRVCESACSRGEPNGGWAIPTGTDGPFPHLANNPLFMPGWMPPPPPHPNRNPNRNRNDAFGMGEAMANAAAAAGANVRMDQDRATATRRMSGAGAGVIPVIATAVLMALFRD